jgi:putative spermidine/putrescine transport system ATP-binding protein/spermidine/putrescine transport system ATP-binding protein
MGYDNVLPCTVISDDDASTMTVDLGGVTVRAQRSPDCRARRGEPALLAVRAERLTPVLRAQAAAHMNVLACTAEGHLYRGKYTDRTARMPGGTVLKIRSWDQSGAQHGPDASSFDAVACRPQDCVVLPH